MIVVTINIDDPDRPIVTLVYAGGESRRHEYRIARAVPGDSVVPVTHYTIERTTFDGTEVTITERHVGSQSTPRDLLMRYVLGRLDDALHTVWAVERDYQRTEH